MADTMQVDLVSPERLIASVAARAAQIPGVAGELTAMPGHAPFLTTLRPGLVVIHGEGGTTEAFVTGGFVEITPDGAAILAEEAVERAALDRAWFDAKIAEAEAALEAAPEPRRAAAALRLNDFRVARDQFAG